MRQLLPKLKLSLAALTSVAMVSGFAALVPRAVAIRNGKDERSNGLTFALASLKAEKKDVADLGTAFAAVYPRCLVTARHVSVGVVFHGEKVPYAFMGHDVVGNLRNGNFADIPKQGIANGQIFPGNQRWRDISVEWAENKIGTSTGTARIPLSAYTPAVLKKPTEMGLISTSSGTALDPALNGDSKHFAFAEGYGFNGANADVSVGEGFRRLGRERVVAYHNGTQNGNAFLGSLLRVWPARLDANHDNTLQCKGDSGGPLFASTLPPFNVYGIAIAGAKNPYISSFSGQGNPAKTCNEYGMGLYAAFHSTGTGTTGNWEGLTQMIQEVCTKELVGHVEGPGIISGSILPIQDPPRLSSAFSMLNNRMDCLPGLNLGDCFEYIHAGQTMRLVAKPEINKKFLRWKSQLNFPEKQCPCEADRGNPVCVIPYDSVGLYDHNTSSDISVCIAEFGSQDCGDENVDEGESCDDGGETATCDLDCSAAACGDENLNTTAGETCDDDNTDNGDGCSSTCQIETNYCGDGVVDSGEDCDDGQGRGEGVDSDMCNSDCTLPVCGDSYVNEQAGEICDDGNDDNGDDCNSYCLEEVCGNAFIDVGEACDDGVEGSAACTDACALSSCGDSVVNEAAGETCDDGDTDSGDGCSSICREEDETCGDGNLDGGEYCDNGGMDTDTCDADCSAPSCGDDHWNLETEQCDDGNNTDSDGCSSACNEEAYCGDTVLDTDLGEECDDGDTDDGDGCNAACLEEGCGNGMVDSGEQCDDGNTTSDDGCSSTCQLDLCGNGDVNSEEDCDDSNTSDGDGCDSLCRFEYCGNARVDTGEDCDLFGINTSLCDNNCSYPVCGDNLLNTAAGEACDDGNTDGNDGCSATCTVETAYCGDGDVDSCEECDDGNDVGGDGCDMVFGPGWITCRVTPSYNCSGDPSTCVACGGGGQPSCTARTCGDGVLNDSLNEQCDDGNTANSDGCNSICEIESGYECNNTTPWCHGPTSVCTAI